MSERVRSSIVSPSTGTDPQREQSDVLTPKSQKELDALLLTAKREMSKCVLDSSWTFTIPSVIISVPLSIRYKTYAPLVLSAVIASGVDYSRGLQKCQHLSKNIETIRYAIALQQHKGLHPGSPSSRT